LLDAPACFSREIVMNINVVNGFGWVSFWPQKHTTTPIRNERNDHGQQDPNPSADVPTGPSAARTGIRERTAGAEPFVPKVSELWTIGQLYVSEVWLHRRLSDREDEMDSTNFNLIDKLVPNAGAEAQEAECCAQNTLGAGKEIDFEEGQPWLPPPSERFRAEFRERLSEAEDLERKIADIESSADKTLAGLKGSLAPLETKQIIACFQAMKLVEEGKVSRADLDQYASDSGVRVHGNEKIPCSRLMRAIVANGAIKGTPANEHKRARASTYASAIDYAVRQNWTEEEFAAELDRPRKPGERHGIEYLAAQGRKERRAASSDQLADYVTEALMSLDKGGAFVVSGDFSRVTSGYRLVVINVRAETTVSEAYGEIIDPIDEDLTNRILRQWVRAQQTAQARNAAEPSAQSNVSHECLRGLANRVNSNRLM
jgi:hypothetical protein